MTDVAKARPRPSRSPSTASRSTAPKGALLIRVAEQMGIEIPRFCDHPLLAPAGACRQCLVEVEGQRKPVASCTQTVADGMVVRTQLTSPVAKKAQEGIMELLLINHPLDCPMCDKGGECPLQNQAMSTGRTDSRFHEHKREYQKPINDLHPGAAGPRAVRALPALHPVLRGDRRRQVHRPDGPVVRRGDQHLPGRRVRRSGRRGRRPVQLVLLRQHRADLPGGRADRRPVPVPGPPVRPGLQPERVRALLGRLRPAHRPAARQGAAPAGRRRPGGQRGVELRQGPLGLPVRHAPSTGSPPRWSATRRPASCARRPGARRCTVAAEGLRAARDGACGARRCSPAAG